MIAILTIIFALILLFLGFYLFNHRNKAFLYFDPNEQPGLHATLIFWGIEFIILGLCCLVVAFLNQPIAIIVLLVIGSFSGTFMLISMSRFLYRN